MSSTVFRCLGVTATGQRRIYEGREYYDLFPIHVPADPIAPAGSDSIINRNAEVHDTLHFVARVVANTLIDTKKLAAKLKKENNFYTCKADFDFFYRHYNYKLDKDGVEQVRRPARAWKDRKSGIDCDCFTTSVSSVLTNQGIPHYLKIIGIKNRDYFQHIYVVVPKFPGADITKRSNYWVIDPVLDAFDKEAPEITKTDYLKMDGIPLQYLNGLGDTHAGVTGLGREFDTLEESLSGIDDMEGLGFTKFRRALHAHVRNTARKIQQQPSSVEAVYEPATLGALYDKLDQAFMGTDEFLMSALEDLSSREHLALKPRFHAYANAVHVHDDALYGAMFGEVDDSMIAAFSGLGKKGKFKAAIKKVAAKVVKAGPITKIKNGVKAAKKITKNVVKKTGAAVKTAAKATGKALVKAGKATGKAVKVAAKATGKALVKVGKAIVKFNPVSVAARAGFLVAMRTNFGMLAEKVYWGYQTKEFALSKGISASYYDSCVQLLAKVTKTFTNTLKGDSSALKKAVLNGRAAKKIAIQLKKKGMSGGLGELNNYGPGLGVVTAAAVSAAMAFLTPLLTLVNKIFKGKKSGLVETETGDETPPTPQEQSEAVNDAVKEANSPSETIITNDGSVEAADKVAEEPPSMPEESNIRVRSEGSVGPAATVQAGEGKGEMQDGEIPVRAGEGKGDYPKQPDEETDAAVAEAQKKVESGKSKTGLALAALAIVAGIGGMAYGLSGKKNKKPGLSGVENLAGIAKKKSKKSPASKKIKAVTI